MTISKYRKALQDLPTVLYSLILALSLFCPVDASDRDTEPYLIYVDPVTGKYTTNKPPDQDQQDGSEMVTSTDLSETDRDRGKIFYLSVFGGVVIISGVVIAGFVRRRNRLS